MKYTTAILSTLMASAAVAQPHIRHQHNHNARHEEKRAVVMETVWDVQTEVVDFTTTVWVSAGATESAVTHAPAATSTTLSTSVKQASVATSSASSAAQFDESPTSTYVAPTTSSVYVAPTPSTSSSVYVAPTTSSSSSVYVAPTTSTPPVVTPTSISVPVVVPTSLSSVYVAPVVSAATSAAAVVASTAASTSETVCSGAGSACTGDITFYAAGLGACGGTIDGTAYAGVALPWELMGGASNDNPYCGKTITITCTSTGKTTKATVIDKCMGCSGNSIDLTNMAFDALADEAVGRTQATWYFDD